MHNWIIDFWAKVEKVGECWVWLGSKNKKGYGKFTFSKQTLWVHRLSYEMLVGKIPDGLTIDHLCRNTSCLNPCHLEAVSLQENIRRAAIANSKTHCPNGHELTEDNIRIRGQRRDRVCHICELEKSRKTYRANVAKQSKRTMERLYSGVYPNSGGTTWYARITRNKQHIYLGNFPTQEAAHLAVGQAKTSIDSPLGVRSVLRSEC